MSNTAAIVYSQCGRRWRSEVGLQLPVVPGDGWDVDIRWADDIHDSEASPPGDVIAASELGGTRWYTATSSGSGFHLRFHNCGEFVVSTDLADVQVRRDPSGRPELLPILLAGTASAFLLNLRGQTVLHASAVAIDGSALAFVGQSGRGKSTLAALMCLDGAELVADDVLMVEAGPPTTCIGGASELRLRKAAAAIADAQPNASTRVTADDRLALAAKTGSLGPLPLVGIVIPAPSRTASNVEINRLSPSTALVALLSFPRVHGWRSRDVLTRDFAALSKIVNLVPIYDVTVPWGPPFSPSVARSIAELATAASRVAAFARNV